MLAIEDFFVTTVSRDQDAGDRPAKLIMSDKKSLHLPTEMSAIHLEHTEYFTEHGSHIPGTLLSTLHSIVLAKIDMLYM